MKNVILVVMICVGLVSIQSCRDTKKETATEVAEGHEHKDLVSNDEFACPMGCEEGKTYKSETQCPICNMVLKKVKDSESNSGRHEHTEEDHHEHDTDSVNEEH